MDLLDRLLEHDRWATTQLLALSRDLSDAQLDQPFDIGLGTLRDTFDHLIYNIGFWTTLMTGEPLVLDALRAERQADRSMAALIARYERLDAAFATAARRARDEQGYETTFVDHFGERPTLGGAAVHVVLHNAEHRSEALHILQRLGVPDLPEIDHLLWEHLSRSGRA